GPHERGLPRPVGAEQPGDAGPERAAELGQGHLLAEPHRHVPGHHRGVRDEGRVRSGVGRRRGRGGPAHRSTSWYRRASTTRPAATHRTYTPTAIAPPPSRPDIGWLGW